MDLPSLRVLEFGAALPPLPDPDDPAVRVWHSSAGGEHPFALGHTLGDEHWLHVLDLASYCFRVNHPKVIAIPRESGRVDDIIDRFYRSVVPLLLQMRGQTILHGASVQTPRGVLALCAHSMTGKSTLAYALQQRGYPLWTDDALALCVEEHQVLAQPLPFVLRLRPASAEYFGVAARAVPDANYWNRFTSCAPQSLTLICLLERSETPRHQPPVQIRRLTPADAYLALFEHLLYFSLDTAQRKELLMRQHLRLMARVPVWKLGFRAGLEYLPSILDALETEILNTAGQDPL